MTTQEQLLACQDYEESIREAAERFGINKALMIQSLRTATFEGAGDALFRDGHGWIQWGKEDWFWRFSWLNRRTVERLLAQLRAEGIFVVENSGVGLANWYRVDYPNLSAALSRRAV